MKLEMGIIKIEVKIPELVKAVELFKQNKLQALQEFTDEITRSAASIVDPNNWTGI